MLQRVNRLYIFLHLIVVLFVCCVVLLTSYMPGQSGLLRKLTAEGGLFEWGSFFIAFTISAFALLIYFHSRGNKAFRKARRRFILVIAIGAYLIAMEEISWGQRILGFESSDFFFKHNTQRETNLHNLVSGEYLNLVIYSFIYISFIFLPLLVYFFPNIGSNSKSIRGKIAIYMPSIHTMLMFCFASSMQAYFLPKTLADTTFLWLAMLIILFLLITHKKYRNNYQILHYLIVLVACIIFAVCYRVFDYYNMQYEIREFVIAYAFLYWFFNWTTHLKNQIALKLN